MSYNLISFLEYNPDLFKDVHLSGLVARDTLFHTIVRDWGTAMPGWNEPDLFKEMMENFFDERYRSIERLFLAESVKYNPLENYDRIEDGDSSYTNNSSGNSESKISAMNSSSYQPDSKGESSSNGEGRNQFHSRTHGNIGVTTSQQMLEQERRVSNFSAYEEVSKWFGEALMIRIW